MNATLIEQPVGKSRQPRQASISVTNKAWVASEPKQPMKLEVVDLGRRTLKSPSNTAVCVTPISQS